MGKVYDTQDSLRIRLSYTADVASDIASVKIKYMKPGGATGYYNATHDAANKRVYCDLPKGSPLGVDDKWKFWIFATMSDGRVLPGEPVTVKIYKEGYDK